EYTYISGLPKSGEREGVMLGMSLFVYFIKRIKLEAPLYLLTRALLENEIRSDTNLRSQILALISFGEPLLVLLLNNYLSTD
ncbi:hypothetical protein L9F63_016034, partial [Diploptera punctata]